MAKSLEDQDKQLTRLNTMADELTEKLQKISTLWQSLPSEETIDSLVGSFSILLESVEYVDKAWQQLPGEKELEHLTMSIDELTED